MDIEDADEDRKLFIQAFAEPTEFYRQYEQHRNQRPPLFLNRNLTYVNAKRCRAKKPRRRSSGKFNTLHSIADKLAEQKRGTKHYMTMTFSEFYCDELANYRHAEVQVFHKQNKLTSVIIDINRIDVLKGLSTISLPTESLKITTPDGELMAISTCVLLFKVRVIDKVAQNVYVNRDESSIEQCVFESELELFDKSRNGLVASGPHELTFAYETDGGLMSLPKQAMWKIKHFVKKSLSMNAIDNDDMNKEFLKPAKLMCNLQWSRDICLNNENKENGELAIGSNGSSSNAKRRVFTRSRSSGSLKSRHFTTYKSSENFQCLVYQFIHKNYRQKTEIWDRLKCPWCSQRTANLYILLKHLTLCHSRFKFKYVPGASETRIDVYLNKREMDAKIDPFSRLATKYQDKEPHKRKVMTAILVNHPERPRPRLAEFLNIDATLNRQFYHSYSGLPLKPSELDVNSEDECDPNWLRENTKKMINEFSDVNDGEKEIMKLWNLFVMKHAFISDGQIPAAVYLFIDTHGDYVIANNLYRNFIIHLSNLFDYGLLSAQHQLRAVRKLQNILMSKQSLCDVFTARINAQREHLRTSMKVANVGKTPNQRRTILRSESAIKRRLRSQSRNEIQHKVRRLQVNKTPTSSSPRPVRKLARTTM